MDLPELLLSYGVTLHERGNEYIALCINHAERNPSMSVYINGDGNWKAHCFSCGYHQNAVGAWCTINGLNPENPDHIKQALQALESHDPGGRKYAVIKPDAYKQTKRNPRKMMHAPDDKLPRMDYIKDRETGDSYGDPVGVWTFRNQEGSPIMYEARYVYKGKKEPRVFTYGQRASQPPKWECSHWEGDDRPIYGLDRISTARQVAIFEGCRKAELAQALFDEGNISVAATAWAGGSNAWAKSDWSPTGNLPVFLFPDHDEPGRRAMRDLAMHLGEREIFWVEDLMRPDKWDIADEDWTVGSFLEWVKQWKVKYEAPELPPMEAEPQNNDAMAESVDPPPHTDPTPLDAYYKDGTTEHQWPQHPANLFEQFIAPKLKPGLLPKVVDDFVFDRAEMMDADPSFGGLACIVTAAGVLDDRIRIRVKPNDTWFESARLWGCLIGNPSTGKSQMQMQATRPLAKLVEKVAQQDARVAKRQKILDARYEKEWKKYEAAAIESDNHTVPEPHQGHREERLRVKVKSFTMEALEEVLRDCPRGIFCDVDEISGLIGSFDAYKQSGGKKDRAQMLEAFNGGPYQKDLVGRGSFLIPNWSATILGNTQPSTLSKLKLDLEGDGFLQRFLIVTSNHIGTGDVERPANEPVIRSWHELVHNLWAIKHSDYVTMSPGAMEARKEAMDTVGKIVRSGMIGQGFIGHMGKWAGITARVILVFWCIECSAVGRHPESAPVTEECARLAMRYMIEHLLPHSVAFYEDGASHSDIGEATRNLGGQIVAMKLDNLTTTWLYQHGPSKWRKGSKELQAESLNRLVEYGWLAPTSGISSATRRPTKFAVNPHVHDVYAKYLEQEKQRLADMQEIMERVKAGSD